MQITAYQADKVVAAAVARACEMGISIAVAVVDSDAEIKLLHRMDGTEPGAADEARSRALFALQSPQDANAAASTAAAVLRGPAGDVVGAFGLAGSDPSAVPGILRAVLDRFGRLLG